MGNGLGKLLIFSRPSLENAPIPVRLTAVSGVRLQRHGQIYKPSNIMVLLARFGGIDRSWQTPQSRVDGRSLNHRPVGTGRGFKNVSGGAPELNTFLCAFFFGFPGGDKSWLRALAVGPVDGACANQNVARTTPPERGRFGGTPGGKARPGISWSMSCTVCSLGANTRPIWDAASGIRYTGKARRVGFADRQPLLLTHRGTGGRGAAPPEYSHPR